MIKVRGDGERSFLSGIEIVREFRGKPEMVEAEISYDLVGGIPVFRTITVDGEPIPASYATTSDLLKAYAKARSLAL